MNWLQRTLSHFGEPSTKRHVVAGAAVSLCVVFIWIGYACGRWILKYGDLGAGAVTALSFVGGATAALAGVAYRKLDQIPVGVEAPPAPGTAVVPLPNGAGGDQ